MRPRLVRRRVVVVADAAIRQHVAGDVVGELVVRPACRQIVGEREPVERVVKVFPALAFAVGEDGGDAAGALAEVVLARKAAKLRF